MIVVTMAGSVVLTSAQDGHPGPNEAVTAFNQGQDLHEKNNFEGAIASYKTALRILPEFPEAEYQIGIAQLALNKTSDAEHAFRRAVELRPDWSLAMNGLAAVLALSDKKEPLEEARSILIKILDLEPQNPPALIALVDISLRTAAPAGDLSELLVRITSLTSSSNSGSSLWVARARLESALGNAGAAKLSLAQALATSPDNRDTLLFAADLALTSGDLNRAKEIAANLERTKQISDGTTLLKANIFVTEGKLEDARRLLDTITPPTRASIILKEKILTLQSATPIDLEKRLIAEPSNVSLLSRLCTMYRRDDPAKAVEYCGRASAVEPSNISHAVGFGAALVQARQFDRAINVFQKIIDIAPANSTARANLATALFQLKRYPEAKKEFQWLVNAQPSSAAPYFFLGIIHDHLGEYLDAVANYQQYLRLSDPVANRLDIDRVNLRMPALQKYVNKGKSKQN